MVSKKEIEYILTNILKDNLTTNEKCGKPRPGYKSPQQKLKEYKEYMVKNEEYNHERYGDDQDWLNENGDDLFVSPCGEMQKVQQDLQREMNFNGDEKWLARGYNTTDFIMMNDYLYEKEGYEDAIYYDLPKGKLAKFYSPSSGDEFTVPQMCDALSDVIKKCPPVQEDCVTFRYGRFPDDLKEGDIGKFDGFLSVSYNETVAENFKYRQESDGMGVGGWMENNRKMMRIHTPKGTPCLAMDTVSLGTQDFQSEILFDKGQKYIVISNTPEVVDILLYNDF